MWNLYVARSCSKKEIFSFATYIRIPIETNFWKDFHLPRHIATHIHDTNKTLSFIVSWKISHHFYGVHLKCKSALPSLFLHRDKRITFLICLRIHRPSLYFFDKEQNGRVQRQKWYEEDGTQDETHLLLQRTIVSWYAKTFLNENGVVTWFFITTLSKSYYTHSDFVCYVINCSF